MNYIFVPSICKHKKGLIRYTVVRIERRDPILWSSEILLYTYVRVPIQKRYTIEFIPRRWSQSSRGLTSVEQMCSLIVNKMVPVTKGKRQGIKLSVLFLQVYFQRSVCVISWTFSETPTNCGTQRCDYGSRMKDQRLEKVLSRGIRVIYI